MALLVASAALSQAVPSAGADQLANLRAEAQVLASKIAALGQTEAALGEQYDGGVVALQQANARVSGGGKAAESCRRATRAVRLPTSARTPWQPT